MAVAIVLVIVLALMILWQRQRLLSAGKDFGATDAGRGHRRPEDDADDASRR